MWRDVVATSQVCIKCSPRSRSGARVAGSGGRRRNSHAALAQVTTQYTIARHKYCAHAFSAADHTRAYVRRSIALSIRLPHYRSPSGIPPSDAACIEPQCFRICAGGLRCRSAVDSTRDSSATSLPRHMCRNPDNPVFVFKEIT